MTGLSTHVLDAVRGAPARGLGVVLRDGTGIDLATEITDDDGRVLQVGRNPLSPGTYHLVFGTGAWFAGQGIETFYPEVDIAFAVVPGARHLHVPLLLSPFAYSTYRGN